MTLTAEEQALASGSGGDALGMAMRILSDMGRILGADRLVPVTSAHIDGCLYHGDSGVHFAERLAQAGVKVCVPTTLNVGAINLINPDTIRLPEPQKTMAHRMMKAYVKMGCNPTWTCAPYQAGHRPGVGEDIAWAESNAVVFANSVLGARTNRYGDFIDICAALVGRVPRYGLHLPENRRAKVHIVLDGLSQHLLRQQAFYPVLGAWLGTTVGSDVAVIDGIPKDVTEDSLKALGASAASTGAVALFHVAGVTPEAPTVADAAGGLPLKQILLTAAMVEEARMRLSTAAGDELEVVALGSPHYSVDEFERFEAARAGRHLAVPVYICTSRHTVDQLPDRASMEAAGVRIVVDTCVVVTPILDPKGGVLMTDSGKFANYTPGNTGYGVVFGSLKECVESAVAGRVVRRVEDWQ